MFALVIHENIGSRYSFPCEKAIHALCSSSQACFGDQSILESQWHFVETSVVYATQVVNLDRVGEQVSSDSLNKTRNTKTKAMQRATRVRLVQAVLRAAAPAEIPQAATPQAAMPKAAIPHSCAVGALSTRSLTTLTRLRLKVFGKSQRGYREYAQGFFSPSLM